MRSLSRPRSRSVKVVSGLLWLITATAAFAATATAAFATIGATAIARPVSDPSLYALAGGSLILLGLIRRHRRKG